jgi:hypothetical protein
VPYLSAERQALLARRAARGAGRLPWVHGQPDRGNATTWAVPFASATSSFPAAPSTSTVAAWAEAHVGVEGKVAAGGRAAAPSLRVVFPNSGSYGAF